MKAAVVQKPEVVETCEVETPTPAPREVLVRVAYCGVCGSDVPRVWMGSAHNYPIVLGHEFSGTVVQAGADVDDALVGKHIAGVPLVPCHECDDCAAGDFSLCKHYSFIGSRRPGAFAEYVAVPAENVYPLPDDVSFLNGAFFEPATVALHALRLTGLLRWGSGDAANAPSAIPEANAVSVRAGESASSAEDLPTQRGQQEEFVGQRFISAVGNSSPEMCDSPNTPAWFAAYAGKTAAVVGSGTIGIFLAQALQAAGAHVVLLGRREAPLAVAREAGVVQTALTGGDDWIARVKEAYAPAGFAYVFDATGNAAAMPHSLQLAGNHGRVCMVGTPKTDMVFSPRLWEEINRKELFLTGSWMSYSAPWPGEEWPLAARLFAAGSMQVTEAMIDAIYPIGQAPQAFARFAPNSPKKPSGKILVDCQ